MQIADGTIRFTLCSADGREVAHEIDSLVATTLADNLVAKHQLATKAGLESETYVFTPEFLADLGAAFAKQFTLPTTSSTVALKLWLAAQREVYGLKKNTSELQGSLVLTASIPSS